MKNNSLTTLTTIAIGLAVALLVYIGNISLGQCFQRLEDSKMAQRQFKILDLLHGIKYDLHQAILAEHEYIWGREDKFVQSYEDNMSSALDRITKLDIELHGKYQMTSDELKEYVSVHRRCAHEAFQISKDKSPKDAFAYLKEQGQEKLATDIEDLIDNLEGRTSVEFGFITTQADKGSMQTVTGIAGLMCVALVILIVVIIVVNRYVNERQQAERSLLEAERRFRAVFNQTFQLSFLLNPDGSIIELNETASQLNPNAKDLPGKYFWQGDFWLNKEQNIDRLKDAVQRAAQGQTVRLEEEIKDNIDTVYTVDLSIKPIVENKTNVLFLIAEARDITERKQAEIRVKEFYSTVSHELRTPLTAIRTALGLMESSLSSEVGEKAKPVLAIAEEETDRLIRLINNILDIRKIESGKLDLRFSSVEPSAVVRKSINSLENLAKENKIGFETNFADEHGSCVPDTILADEDKLQQVITNLLSNAIKWSPEGSKVHVAIKEVEHPLEEVEVESEEENHSSRHSNRYCRFEISDDGPGIPVEQREIIFDQFQQVKGENMPPGGIGGKGTGLGLAISKALVQQHGGAIGVVERESGLGSCFWFEIPYKEEPVSD